MRWERGVPMCLGGIKNVDHILSTEGLGMHNKNRIMANAISVAITPFVFVS